MTPMRIPLPDATKASVHGQADGGGSGRGGTRL